MQDESLRFGTCEEVWEAGRKRARMKTEEEIKEELVNMELLFKQDRTFLANETYGYILALKWVLESEEE